MPVTSADWVWITLFDQHIEFCDKWGRKRQQNAARAALRGHNGASDDPDEALAMHVAGLRGECPVYLYLSPIKWSATADVSAVGNRIADLDGWIDVKTRSKAWYDLIVQEDDPPDWAYVLVRSHNHPDYCIVGWCYGHEAQQPQFWSDPAGGRPAYFIREDNPILKPMSELITAIKRRNEPQEFPPGFVGFDARGRFMHFCACGEWGSYGRGASIRLNNLGVWYCAHHRPNTGAIK